MKNLSLTTLLLVFFACKKNEISPCHTLQAEKVITYPAGSDEFYTHEGRAYVIRTEFEYCLAPGQSLVQLLKSMAADSSSKANGICITYQVAKKQKLK